MKHRRGSGPAHRAGQPRKGRISFLLLALAVTIVSSLGGLGFIAVANQGGNQHLADPTPSASPTLIPTTSNKSKAAATRPKSSATTPQSATPTLADTDLPADSGSGRRVVFDQSAQRVWLVESREKIARSYLVSGSLYPNLYPGSYEIYSRSESAVGYDDSGAMKYFARFTRSSTGGAIGFHTIPEKDGSPLQTVAQLGTPQSHGCVRQDLADALALWDFAPIGTKVVVVA